MVFSTSITQEMFDKLSKAAGRLDISNAALCRLILEDALRIESGIKPQRFRKKKATINDVIITVPKGTRVVFR